MTRRIVAFAWMLGGCAVDSSGTPAVPAARGAVAASEPAAVQSPRVAEPSAAKHFGAAASTGARVVPLASIVASPEAFRDETVRTSGTIVRVCQQMGCWLELAADGVEAVRVPMAGHAFFVSRDVAGRPAEVEGTVRLVALSAAAREHLEGEGATATGATLAIEAASVDVR